MKRENNRTPLQDIIPLSTPFVVHIETNNTCNFQCKFCAASNQDIYKQYGIKRGFMTEETFYKIIDDLKRFPQKVKRVYFHVAGEPLLHRNIVEFVKYTKKAQVADELVIFTNGVLLTNELSDRLVESGLDLIQISVEAVSAEGYYNVTGKKIDYEKFIDNIRYLYTVKTNNFKLHAKIIDIGLSDEQKEKFYNDFSNITDECYIEKILDICPTEIMDTTMGIGSSFTQEGKELKEKVVCTNPFYVMDINYTGDVDACSCDWRRKLIMGNVNDSCLCDIWNGDKFNNLRKMQLRGERKKCVYCSDCKAIFNQIDDIDDYADIILDRYEGI